MQLEVQSSFQGFSGFHFLLFMTIWAEKNHLFIARSSTNHFCFR
uniref:Uncharacterized protein n=1 Tax=Anguilla anguilla TaxID=7936 RepID=A0A0E9Q1R1_ANGAN